MDSEQSHSKVGFVSLGCPKALVDSERILTQLRIDGYEIVSCYEAAHVVVVNTCGFIDSAKEESLSAIGEALKANGKVIVTGCLGADERKIRAVHPSVLSVTGPQQYEQVLRAVHEHAPIVRSHDPYLDLVPPQGIKLTPRHYAYLKIAEGCNHKCTFCIIPSMRGLLLSRPVAEILDEAQRLVASGVKELLIISQDTSAYGTDIKYRTGFWRGRPIKASFTGLCEALGELGVWIRLHYVYPYPHIDDVLPLMAERRILPYLDVPFQHGSPRVLKMMRRPAAAGDMLARIERWRSQCPELAIRSTFIVGFPGETDSDFEMLLAFLDAAQLDRVGCFQYSSVEGAAANSLPNHVSDTIKQERWECFMEKQAQISRRRLAAKVGKRLDVLIDSVDSSSAVGRSYADAPEVDGLVYIESAMHLVAGDIVRVRIEHADDYDLHGHVE